MKKRWMILSAVLVVLFQGVLTSQYAQDVATDAEKANQLRHAFAISVLRTLGTAEVTEHSTYGSYSPWQTLVAHYSEYFDKFIAMHRQLLTGAHFADPPEILPGWNLRMNIHIDGQGYDVLLRDITDEKCGYAALTDENGVIRQSKAIDCKI